ncbi:hypothetical protein MKW92_006492 [Papaver armeniacum]|nr:hypothetical protein MKW92_006492 [Papaver armeniacum]
MGTGFIVDKKRGIILTNRHVASTGPIVVQAKFSNEEVIPVLPLYEDPVHDFAFLRYYPDEMQYLEIEEIPLVPQAAKFGIEICIVGYCSDKKVSTLACLDRDAPLYTSDYHNDFDTFYMQAAAGAEKGSSGSPVVDKQGRAIALHAGGSERTSAVYLLPLQRVVRALSFIQNANEDSSGIEWETFNVPRGTLQATFIHKSFFEVRIRGLTFETEEVLRQGVKLHQMVTDASPFETGVLVVDSVIPKGPADTHLESGDIFVKVNGQVVTQFLKLETILDDNVGQNIDLVIQRGDKSLTVNLTVQDFHSITPNFFLEVSGSVIQPLPYQLARNLNIKCGLVYVAVPGYMLSRAEVPHHSIIKKLAHREITKLEDFILELSKLPCNARVPLEFEDLYKRRTESVLVTVDQPAWYPAPQIYTRSDRKGVWRNELAFPDKSIHTTCNIPSLLTSQETMEEKQEIARHVDDPGGGAADISVVEQVIELITPSLVAFEVHYPLKCMIDGLKSIHSSGTGVVVYHHENRGLVAIDSVPMCACDVMLSFAAFPKEIIGEAVFIHPVHNYALVAYDYSSLGQDASIVCVAQLVPDYGTSSGVLSDERGLVHAIWGRFTKKHVHGISMYAVSEVVKKITDGDRGPLIKGIRRPMPLLRILGAELCPLSVSKAQECGLSGYWVQALKEKDPIRCQVLYVKKCLDGSQAENQLQRGDIVIAINGEPVTCHRHIEIACQGLDEVGDGKLKMTILRQVIVGTELRDGSGVTRLLSWCGYLVLEPPRAIHALAGVLVPGLCKGSPADRYGLPYRKTRKCIVEVNEKPTPDLDSFLQVVKELEHEDFVCVRAVNLKGDQEEFTIEVDDHYWPLWELSFNPSTGIWSRFQH